MWRRSISGETVFDAGLSDRKVKHVDADSSAKRGRTSYLIVGARFGSWEREGAQVQTLIFGPFLRVCCAQRNLFALINGLLNSTERAK